MSRANVPHVHDVVFVGPEVGQTNRASDLDESTSTPWSYSFDVS